MNMLNINSMILIFFLVSLMNFLTVGASNTNISITSDRIAELKKENDHPQYITDKEGKKDLYLVERIKNAKSNDYFRVAIWIKTDNISEISRPNIESMDQIKNQLETNRKKVGTEMYMAQKSLIDHLKSKNKKILYESRYAPVIFAELKKADIQELEIREDVISMQLEIQYQEAIKNSVPTVLAPLVWNYINGGIKVAVVEDDGIQFENPYLIHGLYFNQTNLNIYKNHATGIAGIIASTNSTYRGVAYKGPAILSANSQTLNDSDLINATEWAMDNSVSVLSNSWIVNSGGNWTPITSYYDYIAFHYPWPTIVFAAGNCGQCSYPYNDVGAPALGYNLLAVGSFNDNGTGWNWSDDVISPWSSFGAKSPHKDRQKPEIVAVGCHAIPSNYGIKSTIIAYPWIGDLSCGTSFAAPEVSGEVSLLMNYSPVLMVWPEAVRAIVMASADHNIEGNSRLSSKDGTGGIDILAAYNIVRGVSWNGTTLYYNSGKPWYGPNISTTSGQNIRIVIAWDSNATGYNGNDSLDIDLDLYIQKFNGSAWSDDLADGYSISADNNYEIVEFNTTGSGMYRAKVSKYRWDNKNSGNYLGYAASIK